MKKARAFLKTVFWGYIIVAMIFAHKEIAAEIKEALKLWAGVLIPSLFPYLVLAQYITSSDIMDIFYPFKKLVHKIFNISESSANVYLCSFVSGYPSGAMCASQLCKEHTIKKDEAERLICFTNNAGPIFVISVVGTNMLGSTADGLALYIIQIISAMIVGICLGQKLPKVSYDTKKIKNEGLSFDKYSQNAINTMLAIGGLLILATVVAEISMNTIEMLPVDGNKISVYMKAIIYSFLEISRATNALSEFGNTRLIFAVISSVLSWSGLCVIMQIKSAVAGEFSIVKFVRCKLWQSALSFSFGFIYKSLFVFELNYKPYKSLIVSLTISVIIFLMFLFKRKNNCAKTKMTSA